MRLLTIILLCFTLSVNAQYQKRIDRITIPEPVKVLTIFTASILLDAVGDGLYDNGQKTWGHSLQAASTGLLLVSPLFLNMDKDNFWWYLASYVSLRIAFFDYTYNITRGLPLEYRGSTSLWDKTINEFNPPSTMWHRSVFLTIGIVIPIKELQ